MNTLNGSALRVEWDDDNKKEIEEAKRVYQKAKTQGRRIVLADDESKVVEFFRPTLKGFVVKETELLDGQFSFRIIDDTGDRRLVWDLREQAQVLEASKLFSEYLDKGWRAYAIDAEGNKRRRIRSFNAEKEEILFEELTSSEILTNFADKMKKDIPKPELKASKLARFVEAFKQTLMVPRTYPG
jgi:hypothetical protein